MQDKKFYTFLHKQIPLLIGLSLFPGLAYIFLGWMSGVVYPAVAWYVMLLIVSFFGWKCYIKFEKNRMDRQALDHWYRRLRLFFYAIFVLWTVIFMLYCKESKNNLHYIAIFTQIGASVVASILLVSDKKLFLPVLFILMLPLIIYFSLIGEWYGYVLAIFSTIFLGVLLYSSDNSFRLIEKNAYQAVHDELTELYNRRYFVDYMEDLIAHLHQGHELVYILLIDLDHFKTINDTLGHEVGDKVLVEVARRIRDCCTGNHTVARLGGDEFTVVSDIYVDEGECKRMAMHVAERLLYMLKAPYYIDGHHLYLSASIGINSVGNKLLDARHFIKEADIAMYEAKAQGRDGIIFFNDELAKRVEYHLEIERRLYFALEHDEIELRYQPQVNREQQIIGCEVLVRWNNPEFGQVSPGEFIQVAEKTGLIIELGNYIIAEAFKTLRMWSEKGIDLEQYSINISVRQFFHSDFADEVEKLMKQYLTEETAKKVVFEVTETILIEDMKRIVSAMNRLKSLGISFSMDDFGTGYSSLSSLRELPIDELKIDRSFISRVGEHPSDELMITTILTMANIFKLKTVAEGVETEEQFQFLLKNNCHIYQGFYFSKPLVKEQFEMCYHRENPPKELSGITYDI